MQRTTAISLFMSLLGPLPHLPAEKPEVHKVLFLCTGNYFRSAFAEQYFNHLAAQNQRRGQNDPLRKKEAWRAVSRGLDSAHIRAGRTFGMSFFAMQRLRRVGIPYRIDPSGHPAHVPTLLTMADLEDSERVIALHAPSHRPMLLRFVQQHGDQMRDPVGFLDRVEYWGIEDVGSSPARLITAWWRASEILNQVQDGVQKLFDSL